MPTLVEAPASNANTYITEADADTYFADLPLSFRVAWDAGDSPTKIPALISATKILDANNWVGIKTDELANNALRWPRSYVYDADNELLATDATPENIKRATAELAQAILAGNVTASGGAPVSATASELSKIKVGSIEIAYDAQGDSTEIFQSRFQNIIDLLLEPFVISASPAVGLVRG